VEPQDKSWGSADANGTWRGLVGMALYRKVRPCTVFLSFAVRNLSIIISGWMISFKEVKNEV